MQNYIILITSLIVTIPILLFALFYMKPSKFDEKYYKNTIEELNKIINECKVRSIAKSNLISELEIKLGEYANKIQDLEAVSRNNLNKLISYKNKFKQLNLFVSNMEL